MLLSRFLSTALFSTIVQLDGKYFFLISCILSTDLHAYTISVLCKNLEPPLNVLSFARRICAGE